MGRRHREHQPGAAFHIVSRTQGHYPWFEPHKDEIATIIKRSVASGDGRLIAFAVMPNHLHILMFQGHAQLGWTVQPIFRRIALLIQRSLCIEGHVLERRFRSKLCADQAHLRNSILYIHRNPVEAGLCTNALDYSASSHGSYLGTTPCSYLHVEDGLRVVACTETGSPEELRAIYLSEFNQYCEKDIGDDFGWTFGLRRPRRGSRRADFVPHEKDARGLHDLRDAALAIIRTIEPDCDIDLVRSSFRGHRIFDIRTQLIATLLQRGYKGKCIADYLHLSESSVSRIRTAIRWGQLDR